MRGSTLLILKMEIREIKQTSSEIKILLKQERISEAIARFKPMLNNIADLTLRDRYDHIKSTYGYMLKYLSDGFDDPKRDDIVRQVYHDIYSLLDECVMRLSTSTSTELFYVRRATVASLSLQEIMQQYMAMLNKLELLNNVEEQYRNTIAIAQVKQDSEQLSANLFNKVWCTVPMGSEDANTLKNSLDDNKIPQHFKVLIVSALFLSLIKFYDEEKIKLLLHTYYNNTSNEVQLRSLTCAIIVLYLNRTRIGKTSTIKSALNLAAESPHFSDDVFAIVNRLIRTKNTDNITRKLKDDLMPNIMKMSPDLMNKFKEKGHSVDATDLEANPEWQAWLENSGVTQKIEELNKIQTEGGDVYISTFANLKSYPFFNTISNWFLPFYSGHTQISTDATASDLKLFELIEMAPYLCDSDKYSLVFSIARIPEAQRQAMSSQFDMHNADIKELNTSQLNPDIKSRDLSINCFVQDLYRFFKLFSRRADFVNIFDTAMDFTALPYIDSYIEDKMHLTVIAEFYLANGFYDDAIKYYQFMLDRFQDCEAHVYQKLGFAHQNLGQHAKAIAYYKKYDLIHDHDVWNLKHIATCYRVLKNYEQALLYFKRAEAISPNQANLCLSIGHCLLFQDNIDEALQYYYKVDYLSPGKHKAWRPIAWCSFLRYDYAQAQKYYEKIMTDDTATVQDHMNYAHLLLCNKQVTEAIAQYRQAHEMMSNDDFVNLFEGDRQELIKKGLKHKYISLVRDAILNSID